MNMLINKNNYLVLYDIKNLSYKGFWLDNQLPFMNSSNIGVIANLKINQKNLTKELGSKSDLLFQEIVFYLIEEKIKLFNDVQIFNLNNSNDIEKYKNILNVEKRDGLSKVFRGDFGLIHNNSIYVYDVKNYSYINPNRMKPSSLILADLDSFSKTMDTNLIGLFQQKEIQQIFNTDSLENFINNSKNNFKIDQEAFIKLIQIIEFGIASVQHDFKQKTFIKYNERSKNIEVQHIDFNKIKDLTNDFHYKKFFEKGYFYVQFFHKTTLIYEISIRDNKKPNCSFINNQLVKIIKNDSLNGIDFIIENFFSKK